jgi:hypothetical protein
LPPSRRVYSTEVEDVQEDIVRERSDSHAWE